MDGKKTAHALALMAFFVFSVPSLFVLAEEQDIPKQFFVPPPPFTPGIFPCSQCHEGMPTNRRPRKLEQMHQDIVLKHMPGGWCFDCHNPDNRDKLRGDSVSIWFPDLKAEIKTTISTASKYINPTNRSFKVEVRLPSKLANLKANMIAVLRIIDYKNKSAYVVPVSLVQNDAKGAYLYVLNDGGKIKTAHKRYITPGMTYNGMMEVVSGLNAGDAIVTVGQLGLSEGAKVKE